jgi:excisionase family DNA binding protein
MKAVIHFHNSTGWGGVFPIKTRESVVEQAAVTRVETKVAELETLLTEKQACVFLKTSKRNLYCWRMQGIIPYIKLGRSVRFRLADVQRTLEERTIQHEPKP